MGKDGMYCDQPDRDEPRLKCGYPLPCPWHAPLSAAKSSPGSAAAVLASGKVPLESLGAHVALCGLRAAHGWGIDMFIEQRCVACQRKVSDLGLAG